MAGLVLTETHPIDESYIESTPMTNLSFTYFNVLSCHNVKRLLKKSATKCCTLVPMPTSLLKEHLKDFIPMLTDIIKSFLHSGKFPDILKNTAFRLLQKKVNLPLEDKNYRPVSNLCYPGKQIERAACNQIVDFVSRTGNIENNQSAYIPQTNEVRVRFDLCTSFRQGNHSVDEWYNAIQAQVPLAKYPPETASILHRDIFGFFLKDEQFVS